LECDFRGKLNYDRLSVYNIVNPDVHGGLSFWSWVYNLPTLLLAYGIGASVAGRSVELDNVAAGGLQGILSWALVSTATAFLLLIGTLSGRAILQGSGINAGNWFTLLVLAFGFASAAVGGIVGRASVDSTRVVEDTIAKNRVA
jgi:hypothetical protein